VFKNLNRILPKVSAAALTATLLMAPLPVGASSVALQIGSANELLAFAQNVNNGNNYEGKIIALTSDIDISGLTNWPSIGHTPSKPFYGIFDGRNHTISGLTVVDRVTQWSQVGLFGTLRGATIKNLKVSTSNAGVNATSSVGAVAGLITDGKVALHTVLDNVHVTGSVSASSFSVGLLVGRIETVMPNSTVTINNCTAEGTAASLGNGNVGGLVGYVNAKSNGGAVTIRNSSAHVDVSGQKNYVGGFAGSLENSYTTATNTIENCKTSGNVVNEGSYTGGFTGSMKNFIVTNSAVEGGEEGNTVIGQGSYVGGFVGFIDNLIQSGRSSISNCYTGNSEINSATTVSGGATYTGGFVGKAAGTPITDSYAMGSVVGKGSYTGGFAGALTQSKTTACYQTAGVVSESGYVGGFAGLIEGASVISNCYALGGASAINSSASNIDEVGAFAGRLNGGSFTSCYASGTVYSSATATNIQGAFAGTFQGTPAINTCFYDRVTTFGLKPVGNASTANGSLSGVTTQQIFEALGLHV
jgi:hypothetical protein